MTRAEFFDHDTNRAGLAFDDEDPWSGSPMRREHHFRAPEGGGYVFETGTGRQLCERFGERGATLLWSGQGRLVDYLRGEYRRMRAAERRERERW